MSANPSSNADIMPNLPAGWQLKRLRDVLLRTQYGLTAPVLQSGATPIVGMKDIVDGRVVTSGLAYVAASGSDVDAYRLRPGDILLNRTNSPDLVGKIGIVTEETDAVFASYLVRLEADPELVRPDFLNFWLNTPAVKRVVDRVATRAVSQANVNPTRFVKECFVPVPSSDEQGRIADILNTWESGIRIAEELRDKVSSALNAYLREYLYHAQGNAVQGREGWKVKPLGSVGRVASGGTPSTAIPQLWDGGIAWITPAEITALKSRYASGTARTISEAGLRASAAEVLPEGSLIVCTRASVGEMAINTIPMATNQGFKSVVPGSEVSVEFLYYYMRANLHALERLAAGSTFSEVSKTAFEGITVTFPPLPEQHKIAGLLGALDDQVAVLQALIEKLQIERRGLMSSLLSGRIRLADNVTPEQVEASHA